MDKKFQSHLPKIGITVDEDAVSVLRNDWDKSKMVVFIQASHDLKTTSTREFPFATKLWPQKIADACRNIWQTLSNAKKNNAVDMMQASFRQYIAEPPCFPKPVSITIIIRFATEEVGIWCFAREALIRFIVRIESSCDVQLFQALRFHHTSF